MEMYKALKRIKEIADAHNLKYSISTDQKQQEISMPICIQNGPTVLLKYILIDDKCDLAIRIFNLFNSVPSEKRAKMINVCNTMNNRYRFFKFTMDEDGNISVEFDCPDSTSDESFCAIAMEMFVRIAKVLNEAYMELAKALYYEETSTDMKAIVENANLESLLKDPDSAKFASGLEKTNRRKIQWNENKLKYLPVFDMPVLHKTSIQFTL